MPFVSLTLLLFFVFRSEIATLTEKVRALEIAQVNQRKQQAIIMAALAAEKLKKQKNNEFQSDSNLTYYSENQGLLDPNAGDQPNNLLNHGGAFLQNCVFGKSSLSFWYFDTWNESFTNLGYYPKLLY